MKRTLITTLFLTLLGLALAAPPVDVRLVCGEGEDAPLIGVASLVEDQLHVALIDGALEACTEGVYGVADGATVFAMSYTLVDGELTDVDVAFEDAAYAPTLTYAQLPEVAVEGKLGAQQNREAAFARAEDARARAEERRGGPPADGDDDPSEDEDVGEEADEGAGGPPADGPAPAAAGRR
jgi:hypothetical protein